MLCTTGTKKIPSKQAFWEFSLCFKVHIALLLHKEPRQISLTKQDINKSFLSENALAKTVLLAECTVLKQ